MSWYNIKAQSDNSADVYIFGVIGWEVMAAQFVKDLRAIKAEHITVRINSEGGSVFDGIAIYNAIRNHGAKITTRVEGIAASMASVLVLAGDERLIADAGFVMMHNAWTWVDGESGDLRKAADVLDKLNEQLAAIYSDRLGKSAEEVRAIMDAETWWNADEAISHGFATGKFELVNAAAAARLNLSLFSNAPKDAIARFNKPSASKPEETQTQKKGKPMNEKLKKALVAMGIQAELTEDTIDSLLTKISELQTELQAAKDALSDKEEEVTEEQARVEAVLALGDRYGLGTEALAAVKAKTSLADFTAAALDAVAKRAADASEQAGKQPKKPALGKQQGEFSGNGDTVESLRAELTAATDPIERGRIAARLRKLRDGDK